MFNPKGIAFKVSSDQYCQHGLETFEAQISVAQLSTKISTEPGTLSQQDLQVMRCTLQSGDSALVPQNESPGR